MREMMFLTTILTALAATQAAVAVSDNGPKRNLKGRQVASEPPETTMAQNTKPRKMLHSRVHVPAESRIVGGSNTQQGEYPFFVQGNGCGGSLVWDDIVLTAAHCQGAFNGRVLVGPYIESNTSGGAEYIDVAEQVPHPSYNSNSEAYDFMLLRLENSVDNPNLTPIAVNSVNSNPANNDVLTVIGFGATSEGGSQSSRLKEVNVNYIDYETCNDLYDGDIVDSVMLCAGVSGGGKDSCQGDSGGPIFDQDGIQVGVVSWGYGCAQANYPGVYSRVSGAKEWIDAEICELSSNPPASCGQTGGGNTGGGNTGDNEVVIEVIYDGFPGETGWTLRDSAGTLIAGRATGSFSTEDGTVSKTAFVADGAYTFELTDAYGDGFCCDYGNGEFKITVNGVAVVTGSNGQFQDVTTETFNVVGPTAGPGPVPVPVPAPNPAPVPVPAPLPVPAPVPVPAPTPAGGGNTGNNEVVIEVIYDGFPGETGWTLRDSAGTLIFGQATGSVSTESGTVSKNAFVADGPYTFEITDAYGDGICCDYGSGEFKITVNGEPVVTGSNGQFQDGTTETFNVVGLNVGPPVDIDYRLDVQYDQYPYETSWSLKSLTTGVVAAAYGFDEVTESGLFLSESVDLVPGDTYKLVIIDSEDDGMCCTFGNGSIALYATIDGSDVLITSSNGTFGTRQTNVFTVPDLAVRSGFSKKKKKAKKPKKNGTP
jgi:hypothetical protein